MNKENKLKFTQEAGFLIIVLVLVLTPMDMNLRIGFIVGWFGSLIYVWNCLEMRKDE